MGGLNIFWERKKGPQMWKKLSWKSVQDWVENLSNYVAQHNRPDVQLKKIVFCLFLFFLFFNKNRILPAKRRIFLKHKKKRKIWTDFQLKEGQFWNKFQLYSKKIYIYINIDIDMCWRISFCTTFWLFKTLFLYHLKSQFLYHVLGDPFHTIKRSLFVRIFVTHFGAN